MRISRAGSRKVRSLTALASTRSRAVRFQATLDPTSQKLTADSDGPVGIVGAVGGVGASVQAPIASAKATSATLGSWRERYDIMLSGGVGWALGVGERCSIAPRSGAHR